MNNPVVFLDYDGVINTLVIYKEPVKERRLLQKDGYYLIYAILKMKEYPMFRQSYGLISYVKNLLRIL